MFELLKKSKKSKARLGRVTTAHGSFNTPVFLPDATRGYVKQLSLDDLEESRVGPMVVNTFHLYLQPNMKIIKKAGGIHKFMSYDKQLLSDSGGFQVYSLIHENPKMGKIEEDKVIFKSPIDGSEHEFTPKKSIGIQFDLATDMIVCLDDCPPNDQSEEKIKASVRRTVHWAKKCRAEYEREIKRRKLPESRKPLIFSVIQGGQFEDLREKCSKELVSIGFDGYGFGARPIDSEGKFLSRILRFTADQIPARSIRFALGIGLPEDIVRCSTYGWDMFDCVIPTREGRHGRLFLFSDNDKLQGKKAKTYLPNPRYYNIINIINARFSKDFSPINSKSKIPALRNYNKAFLHHLFKTRDPLGQRLASVNNLEFYQDLVDKLRQHIFEGYL
jgi:queuine tRNA-ribosyltransferase